MPSGSLKIRKLVLVRYILWLIKDVFIKRWHDCVVPWRVIWNGRVHCFLVFFAVKKQVIKQVWWCRIFAVCSLVIIHDQWAKWASHFRSVLCCLQIEYIWQGRPFVTAALNWSVFAWLYGFSRNHCNGTQPSPTGWYHRGERPVYLSTFVSWILIDSAEVKS